jgi:hypothetical protein
MFNKLIESPFLQHPKAWWLPFISLFITLQGIIFLGWNLQPVVVVFWWEVILNALYSFYPHVIRSG